MTGLFSWRTARQTPSGHPLLNLDNFTQPSFFAAINAFLADQSAVLTVPVNELTALGDIKQLEHAIREHYERFAPSKADYLASVLGNTVAKGSGAAMLGTFVGHVGKGAYHTKLLNTAFKTIHRFTVNRPAIDLSLKEQQVLRAIAQLTASKLFTSDQWSRHLALMAWNNGNGQIVPDADIVANPSAIEVKTVLHAYIKKVAPDHEAFLADEVRNVARSLKGTPNVQPNKVVLQQAISRGAKWMEPDDLDSSPYYDRTVTQPAVLLGYESHSDAPVYYSGNESLITVGGPGSGKSQAQVVPNLLRYRGSAIVLDVKGELWDLTAGYRQKHFGPVYRFAPTDPNGNTHRYNPFDFISKDPDTAANDATVFSYQVVLDNPKLHDPYWESKGRDFIWAFAMMIALKADASNRTMHGLAELLSLPLTKDINAEIYKVLGSMKRLSARTGIHDLEAAANALASGMQSGARLESVVDTARRHLSIFTRTPSIARAMLTSDWRPEHFRTRPGTTLYICLSPSELKSYAPIVRVILTQHARTLLNHNAKPGELPITFFLDEMPQLGNFESLLELQDVGRGAGLRLWMFAQNVGQLATAFGQDRFEGVIEACRTRCFLQPDNQAAKLIEPALGSIRTFKGDMEPLATASDLRGRAYGDKIITTTRGDHPMALNKRYAYNTDAAKFLKPPVIKKSP